MLVKMDINAKCPQQMACKDEFGAMIVQKVEFKWNPLKYARCEMFGHSFHENTKKTKLFGGTCSRSRNYEGRAAIRSC